MLACSMVCSCILDAGSFSGAYAGFRRDCGRQCDVVETFHPRGVRRCVRRPTRGWPCACGTCCHHPIGWIGARDPHDERLHRNVFLAGGGGRIVSGNCHWFVTEQLAAASVQTDALSSRFEFMTSVGWQSGHFVIMLRHISDGHLTGGGKNLGETMALAGIHW